MPVPHPLSTDSTNASYLSWLVQKLSLSPADPKTFEHCALQKHELVLSLLGRG